jgi:hypothetical protein
LDQIGWAEVGWSSWGLAVDMLSVIGFGKGVIEVGDMELMMWNFGMAKLVFD